MLLKLHLCCTSLVIALLITAASPVFAQDPIPQAITPENNTGDLPYSMSSGSPTEHVEISSGNLIVTIPFVDVPGRHMTFDFGIRFDSRFWIKSTWSKTQLPRQ